MTDLTSTATDAEWDAFVDGHPSGHLLQASAWGHLRAAQGWSVARVVVRAEDGSLVAGAQVLTQDRPGGRVAYVPRGPVCAPRDPAWARLRARLRAAADGAVAVRIEPHWPDSADTRAWLAEDGWRAAEPVQPQSTLRLDLTPDEDTLLADMKSKWRYNVRLAGRRGVEVTEGTVDDLPAFGRLMALTAERNAFGVRDPDYYADVYRAFGPEVAHLYLATYEDTLLAAIMVFHFAGTATYLYGASSNKERQRMPNHRLQWIAIKRAKADGCRWYDFWGVPDALGRAAVAGRDPHDVPRGEDGLWGVWGFKRGFGGAVVRTVGAWDLVGAPVRYWLGTTLVPRLRAALAGLRS